MAVFVPGPCLKFNPNGQSITCPVLAILDVAFSLVVLSVSDSAITVSLLMLSAFATDTLPAAQTTAEAAIK